MSRRIEVLPTRKVPCQDCQDRKIGCHATCERYKKAKAEWDKARELEKQQREKMKTLSEWDYKEKSKNFHKKY